LSELAAATDAALVEAGWQPDSRPFRPHLTLARSDGVAAGRMVADRLAAAMADRRIRATIDQVGLFESVTGGGPARYVPVTIRNFA
jgi:2'-5' RNA ligase